MACGKEPCVTHRMIFHQTCLRNHPPGHSSRLEVYIVRRDRRTGPTDRAGLRMKKEATSFETTTLNVSISQRRHRPPIAKIPQTLDGGEKMAKRPQGTCCYLMGRQPRATWSQTATSGFEICTSICLQGNIHHPPENARLLLL